MRVKIMNVFEQRHPVKIRDEARTMVSGFLVELHGGFQR